MLYISLFHIPVSLGHIRRSGSTDQKTETTLRLVMYLPLCFPKRPALPWEDISPPKITPANSGQLGGHTSQINQLSLTHGSKAKQPDAAKLVKGYQFLLCVGTKVTQVPQEC